ncbi:MAG: hypothetical protein ACJAVK_001209, partial [Akkermansiaceae bacterium]
PTTGKAAAPTSTQNTSPKKTIPKTQPINLMRSELLQKKNCAARSGKGDDV